MRALLDDLAFTARTLRSNVRFTAAVTLILALGIGANSAIFTLVDAALFRGLPVERPNELVRVFSSEPQRPELRETSYPGYLDLRDNVPAFSGLAAFATDVPVHLASDARLPELFDVEPGVGRERLLAEFGPGSEGRGGNGRFGLWTRHGSAILHARRAAFADSLPEGGDAVRRLDVTLASVAIERLSGIDPSAVAQGRIAFTMDAAEAIAWVDAGAAPTGDLPASAALLLDPTPASEIVAVAADGDVMPQKSTYIYPKALTGLVINPLE